MKRVAILYELKMSTLPNKPLQDIQVFEAIICRLIDILSLALVCLYLPSHWVICGMRRYHNAQD